MITKGTLAHEIKLPPVRILAKQFQTSHLTVVHAMKLLEEEKLVVRKHRSGIYNANAKEPQLEKDFNKIKKKHECVADQIEEDIQQSRFKIGSMLPSNKVLSFRYHVSGLILRLALKKVNDKGLIHRYAGHWIAGGKLEQSPDYKTRKYVYIIGVRPPFHRQFDNTFNSLFLRSIETELQNQGLTIKEYLYPEEYKNWVRLIREPSTSGFVVIGDLWSGFASKPLKTFQNILLSFRNISCPLVINDFNYPLHNDPVFRSPPLSSNIFPLWYNEQRGPEIAANYLALLGHKKVAFLTRHEKNKSRFLIMESKLKQLFKEKVESFFYFVNISTGNNPRSPLSLKQIPSSVRSILPAIFWDHNFKKVDPLESLYMKMGRTVNEDLCFQEITPILEELLKNKDISVWVCDEILISLTVADFLEEKGIRIPEQLSIFSLYGDEFCSDKGITTFEKGHDIAGYLAAHCILGDIPIRKNRKGLVEIEGKLMVRTSTRPAK